MRISTPQFYGSSLTGILNQQNTLNTLSQQLATGSRIVNPSDAPVAVAQNAALNGQIERLGTYTQNAQYAQGALQLESKTLQSVGTLIDQVRQLAVQMNNATVNAQDLRNAAAAMKGYVEQLAQYANTQDGQGNYIFAGSKSDAMPFVLEADGRVRYLGDGGQNQLALGPSLSAAISDAGDGIFLSARAANGQFTVSSNPANSGSATAGPGTVNDRALADQLLLVNGTQYQISFSGSGSGTTYTITSGTGGVFSPTPMASGSYTEGMSLGLPPGGSPAITVPILGTPANGDQFTVQAAPPQGLFETFQSLAAALTATDTSPGTNARRAQAISNALASLDQNQTRLLDTQATIGARLQQVQAVQAQNTSLTVRLQTEQSELTQINYPEVITRYQQSLTALQAAQKAFVQLQGMNLFQYL